MNDKTKIKAIILRVKNQTKEIDLPSDFDIDNIEYDKIRDLFKTKGIGKIQRYCSWHIENYYVSIIGWKDGKAGKENKNDLPPPEEDDIFFGDILVLKSNVDTGELLNFNMDDYNVFCSIAYGGFESLGDEDSLTDTTNMDDEEDTDDDTDSFIDDDEEEVISEEEEESEESDYDSEDETLSYEEDIVEYEDSDDMADEEPDDDEELNEEEGKKYEKQQEEEKQTEQKEEEKGM